VIEFRIGIHDWLGTYRANAFLAVANVLLLAFIKQSLAILTNQFSVGRVLPPPLIMIP
jgi:hypothetical protein